MGAGPATEDDAAQQLLAAAVQDNPKGDEDQLGDAGKRALDAERAARKKTEKQVADLEQQLAALKPAADIFAQLRQAAVPDAEKTDTERLQEQIAKLQEESQAERVQRWRLEIGAEKGLTREQAAELRGSTQEELVAHADRLLKLFPQAPPPPPADPPPAEPAPNGQQATQPPTAAPNGPRPDPSQGARAPVDINTQSQDALAKGDIKTHIALEMQRAAAQGAR